MLEAAPLLEAAVAVPVPVAEGVLELELETHASRIAAAIPAAAPVRAVRRVNWRQRLGGVSSSLRSSHSRRSTASPIISSGDTYAPPLVLVDRRHPNSRWVARVGELQHQRREVLHPLAGPPSRLFRATPAS